MKPSDFVLSYEKTKQLVYVAGPFTAGTPWDTHINVLLAEQISAELNSRCYNAMAVCPHTNSAHMVGIQDGQYWLDCTKELMRRCDAVLIVPCSSEKLATSKGTQGEIAEATRLGIPIYYTIDSICEWLNSLEDGNDGCDQTT